MLQRVAGQRHSAVMRMELRVNGHVVPICQMGPDYLVVGQPFEHPPANAEVSLRIDNSEMRRGAASLKGSVPRDERRRLRSWMHKGGGGRYAESIPDPFWLSLKNVTS
jgi:hypothetical protein